MPWMDRLEACPTWGKLAVRAESISTGTVLVELHLFRRWNQFRVGSCGVAQLRGPPGEFHGESLASAPAQTFHMRHKLRIETEILVFLCASVTAILISVHFHS